MIDRTAPIIAIATAPGRGAVGIVRASGTGLAPWVRALCQRELIPREATLLPLRVLAVVAPAVFTPQAAACVGLLVPLEQRGRAITFIFLGWSVASVLGMPLASFIGGTLGWRQAFLLVAGLAACGTETPAPTASDAPKSYKLGFDDFTAALYGIPMPAGARKAPRTGGRSGTGPAVDQQSSAGTIREANPPVNRPMGRIQNQVPGRVDGLAPSC